MYCQLKIQGGLVPNQVPDNAIGTINVRNAANATLVWEELKEAFSKIPHMSLILNATMSNPIKFDVIKDWREQKVMPYGKQRFLALPFKPHVLTQPFQAQI